MTGRPLRFAVIGTGKMGLAHARAAASLGHRIVAGCAGSTESLSWKRFSAVFPDAATGTFESLCGAPDIDRIIVALPWRLMPGRLRELLNCPKPMLLEKPLALNSRELDEARADAAFADTKRVAMNRRFYRTVTCLAERIGRGGLLSAEIVISEDVSRLERTLGPEIVSHLLSYNSCHILDAALYLLGPIRVVHVRRAPSGDTRFPAIWAFLMGVTPVNLAIYANMPIEVGIRCFFDDCTVWALLPVERLRVFDGYDIEEPSVASPIRRYTPRSVLDEWVDTRAKPGVLEQMDNFCNGGPPPAATLEDAARTLRLIDALRG